METRKTLHIPCRPDMFLRIELKRIWWPVRDDRSNRYIHESFYLPTMALLLTASSGLENYYNYNNNKYDHCNNIISNIDKTTIININNNITLLVNNKNN